MRCNPRDSAFAGSPTLGLTKREWFAGMMMSAILAHPPNGEVLRLQCELMKLDPETTDVATVMARVSLSATDALIAELNKVQP